MSIPQSSTTNLLGSESVEAGGLPGAAEPGEKIPFGGAGVDEVPGGLPSLPPAGENMGEIGGVDPIGEPAEPETPPPFDPDLFPETPPELTKRRDAPAAEPLPELVRDKEPEPVKEPPPPPVKEVPAEPIPEPPLAPVEEKVKEVDPPPRPVAKVPESKAVEPPEPVAEKPRKKTAKELMKEALEAEAQEKEEEERLHPKKSAKEEIQEALEAAERRDSRRRKAREEIQNALIEAEKKEKEKMIREEEAKKSSLALPDAPSSSGKETPSESAAGAVQDLGGITPVQMPTSESRAPQGGLKEFIASNPAAKVGVGLIVLATIGLILMPRPEKEPTLPLTSAAGEITIPSPPPEAVKTGGDPGAPVRSSPDTAETDKTSVKTREKTQVTKDAPKKKATPKGIPAKTTPPAPLAIVPKVKAKTSPPKPLGTWVFKGEVYDLINLLPILDAELMFSDSAGNLKGKTVTRGDGSYEIELNEIEGGYSMTVAHVDYRQKWIDDIDPPLREADLADRKLLIGISTRPRPWKGSTKRPTRRNFVLIPKIIPH